MAVQNYEYRDLLVDIAASDEAWNNSGRNPTTWVTNLYRWFYNRQPDTQGYYAWLNEYNRGTSRKAIATAFAYSHEWNQNYVANLYQIHLNRGADQAGLNFWTGLLDRKEITPQELEVEFTSSGEYYSRANPQNNTGYLTLVYNTLLERQIDAFGLQYWLGWID